MKEIVNRLQEKRQIELATSILESNGYKVSNESKKLNESALSQLWDLYDSDEAVADAIEKIAGELGIGTDDTPTEEEAKQILAAYRGEGNSTEVVNADSIIEDIMSAVEDLSSVDSVESFEEAGLMTKNKGFVVTAKGKKYQFSLLGSY